VRVVDALPFERVCGVDVAYSPEGERLAAAAVVVDLDTVAVVDCAVVQGRPTAPYVPGRLAAREGPWAIAAVRALAVVPDVVICDGQGIAHPDRFGLACHVGTALDLPTVGCAKNHLAGDFAQPCEERGCRSDLTIDGDPVGVVLRTQRGVKPLFVSPGHRVGIQQAAELILALSPRYRLPEPVRLADQRCRQALKDVPRPS
jgi:deoxyribonuclease V